jgi:periplasmic protein CpxP/Spy
MKYIATNKWVWVFTAVLLIANIVSLLFFWKNNQHNKGDKLPQGQVFEFVSTQLNFTQSQRDAYKLLRDEHQAEAKKLRDSIKFYTEKMYEFIKTPTVTDSSLKVVNSNVAAFQQQINIVTFKHFQKVRLLCTTPQQVKFDSIIKEVVNRMDKPKRLNEHPPFKKDGERPPPPKDVKEEMSPQSIDKH